MLDLLLLLLVIFLVVETLQFVYNIFYIKELGQQIRDKLEEIVHQVKVEKVEGMEYWFDDDTDQFLGQGQTRDELINHVKSRFPTHIFLLPGKGILAGPDWQFKETINTKDVKI